MRTLRQIRITSDCIEHHPAFFRGTGYHRDLHVIDVATGEDIRDTIPAHWADRMRNVMGRPGQRVKFTVHFQPEQLAPYGIRQTLVRAVVVP